MNRTVENHKSASMLPQGQEKDCAADRSILARAAAFPEGNNSTADSQSPRTCITGASNRRVVAAGLDWCKIYVFGGPCPEAFLREVEGLKRKVRDTGEFQAVDHGGRFWAVEATGDGKGSNHLPLLLTSGGYRVALSEGGDGRPVAMVEAQGSECAGKAPAQVLTELRELIGGFAVRMERCVVSRLDVHADVEGLEIASVMRAFMKGLIVKRSRVWKMEGEGQFDQATGLSFGRRGAGVYCRLYDKARELAGDPEKAQRYLVAHGLENVPEVLTRVEFELRADYFREWGAEDAGDVFRGLGAIVEDLMEKWIRVCVHVDRENGNSSRATVAEWWSSVRESLGRVCEGFVKPVLKPRPLPDVRKLGRAVVGYVASICGRIGVAPQSVRQAFEVVQQYALSAADDREVMDRSEEKWIHFEGRRVQWEQWIAQPVFG